MLLVKKIYKKTLLHKTKTMRMNMPIKSSLIAPCGMICGICKAYLREKKRCPGCRGIDENKSFSVVNCRIKNCDELKKHDAKFCFECEKLPCARLKQLDKRYRTKYSMSMLENLECIQKNFCIVKILQKNLDQSHIKLQIIKVIW